MSAHLFMKVPEHDAERRIQFTFADTTVNCMPISLLIPAGLQILLSIFGGWLCARLHLVDPDVLSRSLNVFAMRAAFPAFILHLLGIKTDLQDLEAWRYECRQPFASCI
jgi:hypothetical protein